MQTTKFFHELKNRVFADYHQVIALFDGHDLHSTDLTSDTILDRLDVIERLTDSTDINNVYQDFSAPEIIAKNIEFITLWARAIVNTPLTQFPIELSEGAGSFQCLKEINLKAVRMLAQTPYHAYPMPELGDDTISCLVRWGRNNGFIIPSNNENNWCLFAGGATRACSEIFRLVSAKGIVLFPTPTYGNLIPMAAQYAQIALLPLTAKMHWRLTPAILSSAIKSINTKHSSQGLRVEMLVFVNPANPTGVVYSQSEVDALANVIAQENCLVLEDIIHHDLELNDEVKQGSFQASPARDQTITVFGPSKSYCAAGWRLGISYTNNTFLAKKLKTNLKLNEFSINKAYETVAMACYSDTLENKLYLQQNKIEYQLRHALLKLFILGENNADQIKDGKLLVKYIKQVFPDKASLFLSPAKGILLLAEPEASFFQLLGFADWKNKSFGDFKIKTSLDIYKLLSVLGVFTLPDLVLGHVDNESLSVRISISNSLTPSLLINEDREMAQNIVAHYMLGCAIARIKMIASKLR